MKVANVKRIAILILLNMSLLGANLLAAPAIENTSKEVADRLIGYLQTGDLDAAVALFTFPAEYENAKLQEDTAHVKNSLRVALEEFGGILETKPLEGVAAYFDVGIAGGDVPFAHSFPNPRRVKYEVRYAKKGKGYLLIDVVETNSEYKVLCCRFALPVLRPLAKEDILFVATKMTKESLHKWDQDNTEFPQLSCF